MLQGWERAKQSDGLFPVTKDAYPPYDDLEPNQSVFDIRLIMSIISCLFIKTALLNI